MKIGSSAPISVGGRQVSEDGFSSIIERRLLSRLKKTLPKDGIPHLIVTDKVSQIALTRALKRPRKISYDLDGTDEGMEGSLTYLMLPWTAEDIAESFLEGISLGQLKQPLPAHQIPLWWDVSDAEASRYARLRGLDWKTPDRKYLKAWVPILDEHMIFGLARTIENLNYLGE